MRLQLALNVPDIDEAVDFYSKLFSTPPLKTKPGYANFAVENPPLKLVLFESSVAEPGSINHLGVETESAEEVEAAESRLRGEGLATTGIDETVCCYAEKVETWVHGPDGNRWEFYVKQADTDEGIDNVILSHTDTGETSCCPTPTTTDAAAEPVTAASQTSCC